MSGREDDRKLRPPDRHRSIDVDAADVGQSDIEHDGFRLETLDRRHYLRSMTHDLDLDAFEGENCCKPLRNGGVVLDEQETGKRGLLARGRRRYPR